MDTPTRLRANEAPTQYLDIDGEQLAWRQIETHPIHRPNATEGAHQRFDPQQRRLTCGGDRVVGHEAPRSRSRAAEP